MDLLSYLMGKNSSSGGGADLSEYFVTEISSNTSSENKLVSELKKYPPITVSSNVTSLSYCFYAIKNITNVPLDLSQLDTSNITDMSYMFSNSSMDFDASFNTSNVTDMSHMFESSGALKLDCSSFTLKSGVTCASMFKSCRQVAILDISKMDISILTSSGYNQMFSSCGSSCKQDDGAYADGIPYVYVKDVASQTWLLNRPNTVRPSSWTTDNVVVKNS